MGLTASGIIFTVILLAVIIAMIARKESGDRISFVFLVMCAIGALIVSLASS